VLLALLGAARGEDAAIQRAIDAGAAWLKSAQKDNGGWGVCEPSEGSWSGRVGATAFSIYALATCGVPADDPAIERGLAYLKKTATRDYEYGSYEASAVILMLAALHGVQPTTKVSRSDSTPGKGFSDEDWRWLRRCVEAVRQCREGDLYAYGPYVGEDGVPALGPGDVSSTHFAALALRAAAFAGHPVESETWATTVEALVVAQDLSGGFPYRKGGKPSPGMTAAGLSTLLICREQLALRREKEPPLLAAAIEKGFGYLDRNFDMHRNPSPHDNSFHYCHLFAIAGAATLAGRPQIGGRDWYQSGAAYLVVQQAASGGWTDPTCTPPEDILGTCFALLFLKKATPPAVTR
jgi:hypothetical protein